MKSEKTAVKNAILYLKDYIHAYNERRANGTGRKLLESVNVVIDFFNEIENAEQEEYNNEKIREMFFILAFRAYGENVDMQKALNIPMEYYAERINKHYLYEEPVELRFYHAYRDYVELERNIENIKNIRETIEYLRDPNNTMPQEHKNAIIQQCESEIESYTELVKQLS